MPAASELSRRAADRQNGGGNIAAQPCKKRKGGTLSVGLVHTNIVKVGPPVLHALCSSATIRPLSKVA